MTVELVSVTPATEAGQWVARGRAKVVGEHAYVWMKIQFVPECCDVQSEAYDRLLGLLDIA